MDRNGLRLLQPRIVPATIGRYKRHWNYTHSTELVRKQAHKPDKQHDGNGERPEREEEQKEDPPAGASPVDEIGSALNNRHLLRDLRLIDRRLIRLLISECRNRRDY